MDCVDVMDCPSGSACATRACVEGRCRLDPHDDLCDPGAACDVVEGCQPRPPADAGRAGESTADAGVPFEDDGGTAVDAATIEDAAMGPPDGGPPDAGTDLAPDAGPDDGYGAPCESARDCDLGPRAVCLEQVPWEDAFGDYGGTLGFPGGYCATEQGWGGLCPDGAVPWTLADDHRYCVQPCESSDACDSGYECGFPAEGRDVYELVCHPR